MVEQLQNESRYRFVICLINGVKIVQILLLSSWVEYTNIIRNLLHYVVSGNGSQTMWTLDIYNEY